MSDERQNYLPDFFAEALVKDYGADTAAAILAGCEMRRKTSLRVNTLKASREEIAQALQDANIASFQPSFYADAFVLEEAREKDIWNLEAYEQGKLYMQSLSSMIPPLVLGAPAGCDILDMCAAPGGKTCQLAALSGKQAHISACEMAAPRAQKLRYNLDKQGATNVNVMQQDSRKLDEFFSFDRILLDAPCSGSGTLYATNPKVTKTFTPKLLAKCLKQQAALLAKGLTLLKPGGTLVYSTCSVLKEENEAQVEKALHHVRKRGSFALEAIDPADFPDVPLLPCTLDGSLCVAPNEYYEGFFVCCIKRLG